MAASLHTAAFTDLILMVIGPLVYLASGLKIYRAHRGRPLRQEDHPWLFRADLALFISLPILGMIGTLTRDTGSATFSLLFMPPGVVWLVSQWATVKSEEAPETSWLAASISIFVLFVAFGLFAYADIFGII